MLASSKVNKISSLSLVAACNSLLLANLYLIRWNPLRSNHVLQIDVVAALLLDEEVLGCAEELHKTKWIPRLGEAKARKVYHLHLLGAIFHKYKSKVWDAVKKIGLLDFIQRFLF